MIGKNQSKLDNKIVKNRPGENANETMFGGDMRDMRTHKSIIVPSVNTNHNIKIEQGWNKISRQKDAIRVSIDSKHAIVERQDMEQALWAMCQGDEVIKYAPPTINN